MRAFLESPARLESGDSPLVRRTAKSIGHQTLPRVFLMGFWGKECLEQPAAFMNLLNVANLFEGRDTLLHYRNLPWAVKNFLDRYGFGGASVDDALIIADWREGSTLVEHTPILLYDGEQSLGILR